MSQNRSLRVFFLLLFCCDGILAFQSNVVSFIHRPIHPCRYPRMDSSTKTMLKAQSQQNDFYQEPKQLLDASVYQTILEGRIAVIPNFLPKTLVNSLRNDAQNLYNEGHFSTDALAAYGKEDITKFDPSKDRTVLKLNQWKRTDIGNAELRHFTFASIMARVRSDLATNLNRPNLDKGVSTTQYGKGSTEISYTRFGPGAYLKRHIDEHHEELKGRRGWEKPTRRSVSWLIYLNEDNWDPDLNGGFLRCFQRKVKLAGNSRIGSTTDGDLQIGWLRSSLKDPVERPVFLDSRRPGVKGNCALYTFLDDGPTDAPPRSVYISQAFHADPILFFAGGDFFAKRLLVDNPNLASRFHFLEPPKSKITDILSPPKTPSEAEKDESILDVPPLGGTLVLFDSVSLPHEVLSSNGRERWATSGWFHEDQQEEMYHYPL